MNTTSLICPVCAQPLDWEPPACRCPQGHLFDLAKEGYANLLLAHQRRSSHPGDDAEMIRARRRFLDSGAFDPLAGLIAEAAAATPHAAPVLLDAGCGEGRFLGQLSETRAGTFYGTDISKEAVRTAARRYRTARWIVANLMRGLPFADRSCDLLLSVLAPRNPPEFRRILRPDGALLLVVPGPGHLQELRGRLSAHTADFEEKADEAAAKCADCFEETARQTLRCERTLVPQQTADLIRMTPIFWNTAPAAQETVRQLARLDLTVSFTLLTLRPRTGGS